jgi:hypothetical protein
MPPVIISFAASDGPTVSDAASALEARGHEITLVDGVDNDSGALTRAIATHEGQGLYVLCRSAALPRDTIDQLRALLRSNGVPFGRTLTLAVESKRARALEERIISVLKRMVTGRGALPRPVVPVPTPPPELDEETDTMIRPPGESGKIAVAPVPSPDTTATPQPQQPVNSDEIAAWADSLVGPIPHTDPGVSGPWPTPGEPSPAELAGLGVAAENSDPNAATARIEPGAFETGAPDYSGVSTTLVAAPPAAPPALPDFPEVPVQTNLTVKTRALDPLSSSSPSPLGLDMDSSAPDATPLDDDFDDVSFTPGGKFTRALGGPKGFALVVGGVLALVLLGVGVMSWTGDDDADEVAAKSPAAETPAAQTPPKAKAEDADDEEDEEEDDEADEDDEEEDEDEEEDAVKDPPPPPARAPDPEPVAPPAATPPPPAPAPVAGRTAPPEPDDVVPPDPKEIAATPGPGEAAIAAALRDREVRALDIFIVSNDGDDSSFADAEAYCAGLEVAGIDGWRLPTAGELNSLATAKLVRKGVYWSRTLGDIFGDTRLVLNASRERLSAVPTSWTGATPICLRPRS